jgi:hypothetical protein
MAFMFGHFVPAVFHGAHIFAAVMALARWMPVAFVSGLAHALMGAAFGMRFTSVVTVLHPMHAFVGLTALLGFMPFVSPFH